jgi:DNA-binding GntR family transcriptional regulator
MNNAERIYTSLEKDIISGAVQPGSRFEEAELCRQFGVSRTPVREALLQLSATGLIELRPRQGAVVTAIPLAKMAQMFEVMAELEALCASLAAQRMTITERHLLETAQQDCRDFAGDGSEDGLSRYFEANYAFHRVIYEGAHNDFLYQQTMQLRNRLTPYRRFRLQSPARLKISSEEHQQILECILAGDSAAAAATTRAHLTIQSALLADIASGFERAQLRAVA